MPGLAGIQDSDSHDATDSDGLDPSTDLCHSDDIATDLDPDDDSDVGSHTGSSDFSSEADGTSSPLDDVAEASKLWLPSEVPAELRSNGTVGLLANHELRLRSAQADDALADIRRLRRIMAGISQFKRLQVDGTGQKASTRIRSYYGGFQEKVKLAARRYRAAYNALNALDSGGSWSTHFRWLDDKDIRGPGRNPEDLPGANRD